METTSSPANDTSTDLAPYEGIPLVLDEEEESFSRSRLDRRGAAGLRPVGPTVGIPVETNKQVVDNRLR